MENKDIRWLQRFNNFSKALIQLEKFIEKGEALNELEEQGLIQSFEYNFELAWNTIKDYYENQAVTNIQGSKDAFRIAFNRGLITDGETWMKMIESRIKTSHSYDKHKADEIANAVLYTYYPLFKALHTTLEKRIQQQDDLFENK